MHSCDFRCKWYVRYINHFGNTINPTNTLHYTYTCTNTLTRMHAIVVPFIIAELCFVCKRAGELSMARDAPLLPAPPSDTTQSYDRWVYFTPTGPASYQIHGSWCSQAYAHSCTSCGCCADGAWRPGVCKCKTLDSMPGAAVHPIIDAWCERKYLACSSIRTCMCWAASVKGQPGKDWKERHSLNWIYWLLTNIYKQAQICEG